MRTLGAVLYEDFELLDLYGPLEMFANIFTFSGVSAGTDMSLGVIARLYGKEKAEAIAMMTEYEWQSDASRDPFCQYLNQGDIDEYLAALGREAHA